MRWPAVDREPASEDVEFPCDHRGYCGPFTQREVFDAVPGWEGMGRCELCGNTALVARHERLRARMAG